MDIVNWARPNMVLAFNITHLFIEMTCTVKIQNYQMNTHAKLHFIAANNYTCSSGVTFDQDRPVDFEGHVP